MSVFHWIYNPIVLIQLPQEWLTGVRWIWTQILESLATVLLHTTGTLILIAVILEDRSGQQRRETSRDVPFNIFRGASDKVTEGQVSPINCEAHKICRAATLNRHRKLEAASGILGAGDVFFLQLQNGVMASLIRECVHITLMHADYWTSTGTAVTSPIINHALRSVSLKSDLHWEIILRMWKRFHRVRSLRINHLRLWRTFSLSLTHSLSIKLFLHHVAPVLVHLLQPTPAMPKERCVFERSLQLLKGIEWGSC